MSTDIVRWEADATMTPRKVFSMEALILFMAISVPLVVVTFMNWYCVYRCVNRRDEARSVDSTSVSEV